ncbi:MAG: hypothetical protein IAI50_19820, partial [Candidatus Eremiobacteraeota bacterium]|nr:hypothetical protein [Candidatus Eremiobacteraeota bacterium]
MRPVRDALLLLSILMAGTVATAATGAEKKPLDYTAYDGWNAIRATVISDNGRYAAYALVLEDGDGTLVVHDFKTGVDTREPRGIDPAFTADARYLIYTIAATAVDRHAAERAHKKPGEGPQNGLGVLDLTTLEATTIDRVKSVVVPRDPGSDTIAYVRASPSPSSSASALRGSGIAASPAAAMAPSPSP